MSMKIERYISSLSVSQLGRDIAPRLFYVDVEHQKCFCSAKQVVKLTWKGKPICDSSLDITIGIIGILKS